MTNPPVQFGIAAGLTTLPWWASALHDVAAVIAILLGVAIGAITLYRLLMKPPSEG